MQDNITFKGHFQIQALDAQNNMTVLDEYVDDNMIMESARTTMSELFANLNSSTFINNFRIGTLGHIGDSIITPKGKDEGFIKERDRMFSEAPTAPVAANTFIANVRKNDIFFIATTNPAQAGYYRYLGATVTNYQVTDTVVANTAIWEFLGAAAPYTYSITFNMPRTNIDVNGTQALNLVEDDTASGSTVKVLQSGTSVTFTIDVATAAANLQKGGPSSIFTEAALYANNRIFAMKTFKAKVKDSTVLLRIVWTITF
jgi:hypothetical protein